MSEPESLVTELLAAGDPGNQKLGPSRELYRRAAAELSTLQASRDEWRTSHGRVVEGFMEVCEAVGVQFDAPEAVAYAINAKIHNAIAARDEAVAALEWYADLPKEWTINAQGLTYGTLHLLGEKARAVLARATQPAGKEKG